MKTVKLSKEAADKLADELGGTTAKLKKHANTVLTVLLAAAAIYLLIKWRIDSNERTKQSVLTNLNVARSMVDQLRSPQLSQMPVDRLVMLRVEAESTISSSLQSVSENTSDARLLAESNVIRGDLYWQLANLPELPGAATQPSLRSPISSDDLLKKSAAAYNEVLNNDNFKDQIESKCEAHLGLSAIAENQSDWAAARKHLETVANDSSAPLALTTAATQQLALLPQLQIPIYLAPATQAVASVDLPSLTSPAPLLPTKSTTQPASSLPVH